MQRIREFALPIQLRADCNNRPMLRHTEFPAIRCYSIRRNRQNPQAYIPAFRSGKLRRQFDGRVSLPNIIRETMHMVHTFPFAIALSLTISIAVAGEPPQPAAKKVDVGTA